MRLGPAQTLGQNLNLNLPEAHASDPDPHPAPDSAPNGQVAMPDAVTLIRGNHEDQVKPDWRYC